jgi:hypothetical protein
VTEGVSGRHLILRPIAAGDQQTKGNEQRSHGAPTLLVRSQPLPKFPEILDVLPPIIGRSTIWVALSTEGDAPFCIFDGSRAIFPNQLIPYFLLN